MEDMNINNVKAKVLTAALPYIQKYNGKTVVVKYGGNAMIHPLLKKAVMSDIILLKLVGINIVLVHGGGPEISSMVCGIRMRKPLKSCKWCFPAKPTRIWFP